MITKVEIDGFKSLSQFNLNLNEGLNILVGPNGAGKTNVVLFFEFLSKLVSNQVGYAVSSVGGAGSIFKKIGTDKYQDYIDFKIHGSRKINKKQAINYEYCSTIKTSFEKDNIFFSKQEIKLKTGSKFWDNPDDPKFKKDWNFHLIYSSKEGEKGNVEIIKIDKRKFRPRFHLSSESKKESVENSLKQFVLENNPLQNALIQSLFIITDYTSVIYSDLIGGESFNIVPSKVKELEDAATPPGIKKDGSGLATTLYAMKTSKPKYPNDFRNFFFFERNEKTYKPDTLKRIISYLRLANKTIVNLDVENDPFDNKLIVKIYIETGEYDAVLPLSSMSDGTIKWMTLISAILTSKTIFSIEEPENFLHPWMQAEIVNIMRDHIEDKKGQSFVLMTTHSESLLNYSKPEELIIVDLEEGKTTAKRISNIQLIKDEISNSGFGLGSFYFSNSLQNE